MKGFKIPSIRCPKWVAAWIKITSSRVKEIIQERAKAIANKDETNHNTIFTSELKKWITANFPKDRLKKLTEHPMYKNATTKKNKTKVMKFLKKYYCFSKMTEEIIDQELFKKGIELIKIGNAWSWKKIEDKEDDENEGEGEDEDEMEENLEPQKKKKKKSVDDYYDLNWIQNNSQVISIQQQMKKELEKEIVRLNRKINDTNKLIIQVMNLARIEGTVNTINLRKEIGMKDENEDDKEEVDDEDEIEDESEEEGVEILVEDDDDDDDDDDVEVVIRVEDDGDDEDEYDDKVEIIYEDDVE